MQQIEKKKNLLRYFFFLFFFSFFCGGDGWREIIEIEKEEQGKEGFDIPSPGWAALEE